MLELKRILNRDLDKFDALVAIVMLANICIFSYLNYIFYVALISGWDNALFTNMMWNTINGRVFYVSMTGGLNLLANHMTPQLVLAAPFFAIFPNVFTLLVLHVITTTLGVVPFYLFARDKLRPAVAAILSIAFFAYPYTQANMAFSFEGELFLMLCIFAAWFFLERGNDRAFLASLAALLLVKEDVALIGITLGVAVVLLRNKRRLGVATTLISLLYFLFVYFVAFPALKQTITGVTPEWEMTASSPYSHLGSNFREIAFNVIANPARTISLLVARENLVYLCKLLGPVLFLPVLSPITMLIALPTFLETMLSNVSFAHNPAVRYSHPIIPVLFISLVYSILLIKSKFRLSENKTRVLAFAVLLGCLASSYLFWFGSADHEYIYDKMANRSHADLIWAKVPPLIPDNASVATQEHLLPVFAKRHDIDIITRKWPLEGYDYIIIDTSDWHYAFPVTLPEFVDYQSRLELMGNYEIIFREDGLTVYKAIPGTRFIQNPDYTWIEMESRATKLNMIENTPYPQMEGYAPESGMPIPSANSSLVFNVLRSGTSKTRFRISTDGKYAIWLSYFATCKRGTQVASLTLDNGEPNALYASGENKYGWFSYGSMNLSSGEHVIFVNTTNEEDCWLLFDTLLITTDISYVPPRMLPESGRYATVTVIRSDEPPG